VSLTANLAGILDLAVLPVKGQPEVVVGLSELCPKPLLERLGRDKRSPHRAQILQWRRRSAGELRIVRSNCSLYRYEMPIDMRRVNLYIHS
jgi:hypothetical protein